MKIIMLAKDSRSSRIMYNSINKEFSISKVIFESDVDKYKLLKRRIKRLGTLRVFGQILFQLLIVKVLKKISSKRIGLYIESFDFNTTAVGEEKIIRVNSVNEEQTIENIKEIDPDIILVNGTRIISSKVIDCTNATIVNTHVGITPKYRGVHGAYWALVNNDYENVGVTVHLIDKGIDTGGIIYQEKIVIDSKDNFVTYPILQLDKGITLLKYTIKDIIEGKLSVKENDLESKLWSHPTLWEYLYYRIVKNIK